MKNWCERLDTKGVPLHSSGKQGTTKVDASKGTVTESWVPENLPVPRALGGKADVPPGMQQLEFAFVVFVQLERTWDGLRLVGLRNRR